MNSPIKTLFLVGIGIVGACAVLAKAIKNNKTKIVIAILAAKEAWLKAEAIEEASVVTTSPIAETIA